jgi:hypothetical protein
LYVLLESLAAAFEGEDWQEPPIANLRPAGWTAGCCVRAAKEVLSVLEPQVFEGVVGAAVPLLQCPPAFAGKRVRVEVISGCQET